MRGMRLAARVALIAGLGVMILLVAREGALGIGKLLTRAGFALLWLVPLHALPLALDVNAWRTLIAAPVRVLPLYWIGAIRQAVNGLLPVASIGGEIVGIRLLAQRGVAGILAAATVIVEVLLTVVGQYLFVWVGVLFLVRITGAVELRNTILLGLAASAPLVALLIAMLRNSMVFERLELLAARVLGPDIQGAGILQGGADLDAAIRRLCRDHARLIRAFAWQFSGLVAESVETWAALYWLGFPVEFTQALVLESLTQAARRFLFVVPAAVGVQELSFVGVGHVLGLGGDVAIALSLAKRITGILFGVPALLSWQWAEAHRGFKRSRA